MKLRFIIFFSFLCFAVSASHVLADDVIDKAKQDIAKLSSKEFMGRGYQFDGHLKAAAYLENELKQITLQPVNGHYTQKFNLKANIIEDEPFLKINNKELRLGIDFLPHAFSASGKAHDEGDIVFADHGLYIPEKNINDFADKEKDIRGSVVIIDDIIPDYIKKDKSIPKNSMSQSVKIGIARYLKAKAVIFLVDRLSYGSAYKREDIPVFEVLKDSFPSDAEKISYKIETDFERVKAKNVFGILPGGVKQDSFIILCAHYDHLGRMGKNVYFPGANDNAGGVSMVLNLIRYFKGNPIKYSIVPVFFSGEELGLIGSKYFTQNPPLDLDKCKFLINFDCVASGKDGLVALGGSDFPQYYKLLSAINDTLKMGKLGKRKNAANGDHYFFLKNGVKGFYIYTNKGKQPYHSINDKMDTLEWDDYLHVYELARIFLMSIK